MTITNAERQELLNKIDRDSLTLGVSVPDQMEVQGRVIPLQKIVFEVCSANEVPDKFNINILTVKRILRREMNDCTDTIQNEQISYNTGQELVTKVGQIQRALNVLESPNEESDLESETKLSQGKDMKRWQNFVQKVMEVEP